MLASSNCKTLSARRTSYIRASVCQVTFMPTTIRWHTRSVPVKQVRKRTRCRIGWEAAASALIGQRNILIRMTTCQLSPLTSQLRTWSPIIEIKISRTVSRIIITIIMERWPTSTAILTPRIQATTGVVAVAVTVQSKIALLSRWVLFRPWTMSQSRELDPRTSSERTQKSNWARRSRGTRRKS